MISKLLDLGYRVEFIPGNKSYMCDKGEKYWLRVVHTKNHRDHHGIAGNNTEEMLKEAYNEVTEVRVKAILDEQEACGESLEATYIGTLEHPFCDIHKVPLGAIKDGYMCPFCGSYE
jgi:hypothetical protein